jgi:thiol-disulfide isomerase/thioredoxin
MPVNVLKFTSKTCGPCKIIKPALEELKEDYPQYTWQEVDIHDDPHGLTRKLNVMAVPTVVVLKDGKEVGRHMGTDMTGYFRLMKKAA